MIYGDTGFFLALVQPKDALHARAQAWAKAIAEPLILTDQIVWEVVNFLSTPIDRPKAHALVSELRNSPAYRIVPVGEALFQVSLSLHARRPDKKWSLTDCTSFVVMEEQKIARALTHDHHFEQAGFEALLRRDPP